MVLGWHILQHTELDQHEVPSSNPVNLSQAIFINLNTFLWTRNDGRYSSLNLVPLKYLSPSVEDNSLLKLVEVVDVDVGEEG